MAHEEVHHGHHEVSVWPVGVGLGALFGVLAFTAFFQWQMPFLAVIFGGLTVVCLLGGLAGWVNEFFTTGHDEKHGKIAIVFFVASEVIVFGTMFAAFWRAWVFNSHEWANWVPQEMNLLMPVILTLILWASSGAIVLAERAIEHGNVGAYNKWLLITIVLGTLFVILHVMEWIHLWESGFTLSSNMYGTAFYMLTGFHTSHVLVGLIAMLYLLWIGLSGKIDETKTTAVVATGFYWHFVDVVWMFVATNAYFVGSIPALTGGH